MTEFLAPGHHRPLSFRDFAREDIPYELQATGIVRGQNTPHGPRLIVETTLPNGTLRAFFVNFKSASYVHLCGHFGDNLARWSGPFSVRVVRNGRDGRRHVEVQK